MPTSVDIKNLKINKLTEAQYDAAVQGGVIGENELSVLTDAELEQIQVSALPTASADELGNIYQYVGATDANYTNGYFYKCVSDGQSPATYSWAQVNVQPGSALAAGTGIDITNNTVSVASPTLVNSADLTNHPDDLIIASGSKTITRGYGNRNYIIGDKITLGTTGTSANSIAIGYRINYNNYGYTRGVLISPEGIGKGSDSSVIISSKGTAGLSSGRAGGIMITTGINAEIGPNKGAFSVLISSHNNSAKINADYTTFINNGSNSTITEDNTFWWGNYINTYKLVDSDGTIPTDRFTTTPVADGTYVPTLTIASGVATRTWGAAPSAPVVPSTMPELTVAGWSNNTQTVSVTGVTASNIVIVSPAPASAADYAAAGIVCTAQGAGTLTFTCTTVPSNAITVNVIIM